MSSDIRFDVIFNEYLSIGLPNIFSLAGINAFPKKLQGNTRLSYLSYARELGKYAYVLSYENIFY